MKSTALVTQRAKQILQIMINLSGIIRLGPQFIKQRPFVALFLGAFLATAFLPLLMYLLFAGAVFCLGVFLLVVIEGGIITMATITLLVFLIIPACIATGLSLFAYTVYVGLSHVKILVASALNNPQKRLSGERLKERCYEKPKGTENVRLRITFEEKKADPLSQSEDQKASVLLKPQCMMKESDCVRA